MSSSTITLPLSTPSPSPSPVLDGSICTEEERQRMGATLHCLTRSENIGLTIVTVSGFVSMVAVLYFLSRVLVNYLRNRRKQSGLSLISVPMDVFMLSLFASNLIAALGALLNGKWLQYGKVTVGSHCWTQGILLGMGASSLAMNTTVIALHTFVTLFWSRGIHSLFVPRLAVIFIWLLTVALTIAIAVVNRNVEPSFYAPTPDWCWIRTGFVKYQLAAEYLWLWIALFVGLLTYIPLFFWLRRSTTDTDRRRIAGVMLIYPFVYTVLVIPLSVVRWIRFAHKPSQGPLHLSPAAPLAVDAIFHLCGLVDVVVFFQTRRGLLLFDSLSTDQHLSIEDRTESKQPFSGAESPRSSRDQGALPDDDEEE